MIFNLICSKKKDSNNYPIVFVHGFATTSKYFEHIGEMLSTDFDYYAVELPGMGINDDLTNELSPISYANQIIEWINEMEFEKINLIGHSMGGGIVNIIASLVPEKINKLVSICPMSSAIHWSLINATKLMSIKTEDKIFKSLSYLYMDVNKQFPNGMNDPKFIDLIKYKKLIKPNADKLFRKMSSLSNVMYLRKQEKLISVDALLITASGDKIINSKATMKVFKKNKHFKIVELKNLGHEAFLDDPELVYETIFNFLNS